MDVNSVSSAAISQTSTGGTEATKKSSALGRTVGKPQLSETAAKYYEELKSKHSDMEFVLVSKDMKEAAKQSAASYANSKKTVVLIDEEKIEKMATDENFRKKYEGIIDNAKNQIPELKKALENTPGVKGFGMQVNDNGTASFFAVMEKGNKAQAERIAKKSAEKKAEKKAQDKKAEKKKAEEKLEKRRADKSDGADKADKADKTDKSKKYDPNDYETISASSIEELVSRIQDFSFNQRSNSVMTPEESAIGGHIDFSM